ncbi:MAG: hypothetical protein ABFS18_08390 [Thermodesulfobacteriota bacterium]
MLQLTRTLLTILLCFVVVLIASCTESRRDIDFEISASTEKTGDFLAVDDLFQDLQKYLNSQVEVSGVVETGLAFEFVSEQPYRLKGSTNKLWVITKGMSPKEASFITIRGRLVSPYQIKGRKYDLVLLEEERS